MPRRLTDPERQLWKHVTRHVRAIRPEPADETPPLEPAKVRKQAEADSRPAAKTPPKRVASGPPADISTQRRIRRGQTEIDAQLDLHGHRHDEARIELERFLLREQAMGSRCVLVITGKGKQGTGVIRSRFLDWLAADPIRPIVAGYSRAHLRHGGEGAFYVLLKAKKKPA